ncbi:hypothetical protein JZO82_00325 [Vagococcus fluvialis]|uniref:hypothetical protein n=1 Tax=Vagococcus fluvialis TaxID=2738 RepID=UPI001A8E832D|nr:hypothetical protein [Vagococcus fluvialis]MBO0427597.1 hypothetical protein [Vagococcus fluvialis]
MLISKTKSETYNEIKIISELAVKNLELCVENISWYKFDFSNPEITTPYNLSKKYLELVELLIVNFETNSFDNINGFIDKMRSFDRYYVKLSNNRNDENFRQLSVFLDTIKQHLNDI